MKIFTFSEVSGIPDTVPACPGAVLMVQGLSRLCGQRPILDGIDLTLFRGDRIALTGANGSGKTTLLRCLAGETRPARGNVEWFGQAAGSPVVARQQIGLVAHNIRLYPDLTARENLLFAARMCRVPAASHRVGQWLDATGLTPHAHCLPGQISRGMQQRLSVARALIHDPQLILLDEPFTALDQSGTDWLCRLLLELSSRDRAIIFATHDWKTVEKLATRIVTLHGGRLVERPVGSVAVRSVPHVVPVAAAAAG